MNSSQRRITRLALLAAGFTRTDFTSDLSGVGDYAETFVHPDGDIVDIKWSARTPEDAEMGSDDENAAEHAEATRARHSWILDRVGRGEVDLSGLVIISASNPSDEQAN